MVGYSKQSMDPCCMLVNGDILQGPKPYASVLLCAYNAQGGLLDELDQDMDTTQSRLKATQKKMQVRGVITFTNVRATVCTLCYMSLHGFTNQRAAIISEHWQVLRLISRERPLISSLS